MERAGLFCRVAITVEFIVHPRVGRVSEEFARIINFITRDKPERKLEAEPLCPFITIAHIRQTDVIVWTLFLYVPLSVMSLTEAWPGY